MGHEREGGRRRVFYWIASSSVATKTFLAETPKPKLSRLKSLLLAKTKYSAKMNCFCQISVILPKDTVSAKIICYGSLFQSKINDKKGLFFAKTVSFGKSKMPNGNF